MKKLQLIIICCILAVSYSCQDDEGITATVPPQIKFESENPFQEDSLIHAAEGKTFTIEATLTDDVGLKSFTVQKPDWNLNNTVDLTKYYTTTLNEYKVAYSFGIPYELNADSIYTLKLSATNLGDLSITKEFYIRLDGDYKAPEITDVVPGNNEIISSNDVSISFRIAEDVKMKYVIFELPVLNIKDSITSFKGGKGYNHDEVYTISKNGKYNFKIRAYDMYLNENSKTINFTINN